jgi:toxin ParE1/3/4
MPTIEVRFAQEAVEEAREARQWYQERSRAAAASFVSELDRALEQIQRYPALGAPYIAGTRRRLLLRFPFFIVYLYREDIPEIQVVAVAHAKRRPGYWQRRIPN